MTFEQNLLLIGERSAAFAEALAAAPSLDLPVPGCPEWTLHQLTWHLGNVQRGWAVIVRNGASDGPPGGDEIDERPGADELPDWFAASTAELIAAMREVGGDAPSWTWWGASGAPMTAGAVARHQVQEAAVHAYDAQETIGKPEPIPAAVAVDAIGEFIQVSIGSHADKWPHRPARYQFAAVEGPQWTFDLTPAGLDAAPAAAGEPVATIRGTASDLLLASYDRIPYASLTLEGDRAAADELFRWGD